MHHLLYHAQCADGFASAVIARRALMLQNVAAEAISLQPVNYPDVLQTPKNGTLNVDDHLYYLDYTPPQLTLDWLKLLKSSLAFKSLTIIDHHASAASRHEDAWFTSHFDLNNSGAGLTYEHFHRGMPRAIMLIAWRDLGHAFNHPEHPDSQAAFNLHAALIRATQRTPEAWSLILFNQDLPAAIAIGQRLRQADANVIDAAALNPLWLDFPGQRIPAITGLGSEINSEALSAVLQHHPEAPYAASWYVDATTGLFTYSLRSRKGGPNVAEIAAAMAPGGGGHPCAAGFSTPIPIPFAE